MTTKLFATRDFNDAGTGQSYKIGDDLSNVEAGHLANYRDAGLAGDKPKDAVKADEGKADTGTTVDTKTKA